MAREQRRYPRAKIKWPVVVKTEQGSFEGVTLNISPDGVFIGCRKPLKLNAVFDMAIKIPNSKGSIIAKAEVVWSNIYGPDDEISPRGMGVRFLKISGEARRFIAKAALENLKDKTEDLALLEPLQTIIFETEEVKSE